MLERRPAELLLEVLKWLAQDDETTRGSLAILNIARSSHSFYHFVNSWVHTTAKLAADLQCLHPIIPKNFIDQSSFAMSVFCKRIGHICATCNNRARLSQGGERFTKLQLCQACESFLFPKISSTRLHMLFDISPNAKCKLQRSKETLNSFWQTIQNPCRKVIFRWSDVEELVLDGALTLDPNQLRINGSYGRWLSPEEFSNFEYQGDYRATWSHRKELLLDCIWRDSVFRWSHAKHDRFYAIDVELILFKEFRYQLDSSWPPTRTKQKDIKVYSSFARYWATTHAVWQNRPWRLQNFPLPPRCSISNPHADEDDLNEDEFDLAEYQNQCSRLRAVIKAFPDILRSPKIWRQCVTSKRNRNSITEAVEIALSAARVWEELKETEVGFEIRPEIYGTPQPDIVFIRKGKDIKPTVVPLRFPVQGDIRHGSIIQINGDSVKVISPVITAKALLTTEGKVLNTNARSGDN
jgi:hypothetical protein